MGDAKDLSDVHPQIQNHEKCFFLKQMHFNIQIHIKFTDSHHHPFQFGPELSVFFGGLGHTRSRRPPQLLGSDPTSCPCRHPTSVRHLEPGTRCGLGILDGGDWGFWPTKKWVWKWRYSVNFCSKDLESGRIAWFFVQRKNLESGGVWCVCFNHDQKNIPKFGRVAPKLLSPEIYISTMLVNTRNWGLKDGDCLARRLLAQSLGLWIFLPKTDILENLQRIMGKSPTSGSIFAGVPCFKQAPCFCLHPVPFCSTLKKTPNPATLWHLWVVETRPSSLS